MVSGLIPHRYAKALYKYALECKSTPEVYGEMKNVINSYAASNDIGKILSNPFVKTEEKRKLMLAVAGENPSDIYSRFVQLVLEHNREDMYLLMAYAYRDIYRTENHISQVHITTAVALSEQEMQRIHEVVEKSFKDTKFEYDHKVDENIIGGFVIDVDSTRMDASVSGELEQLRQNLLTGN